MNKSFVENNMEMFLGSLSFDARNLKDATPEMCNDERLILAASHAKLYGGEALKYASDRIKYDKNFLKQLLLVNGENIKYVPKELRNDEEIIEIAMTSYPATLFFASDELKANNIFVNKMLRRNVRDVSNLLLVLDNGMWQNKENIMLILNNVSNQQIKPYIAKIADIYATDTEVMETIAKMDFRNMKFITDELKAKSEALKDCGEKYDAFVGLAEGTIKLKDIDKKYFKDKEFYDKVEEEYEERIDDIAEQAIEIEDDNSLKDKIKKTFFSVKEKLKLARFNRFMFIAKKNEFIQDKKQALIDIKEGIKEHLQEFMDNLKNKSNNEEIVDEEDLSK